VRLSVGSVAAGLLLAVATVAAPRVDAAASDDDPWNGLWSVSQRTVDGQRLLVRRNTTAASLIAGGKFPELVRITVPLPRGGDYTAASDLNTIETLLTDALERDHRAISVLVLTTDTARDFVFYASDGRWATGVVQALRPKASPYELKVQGSTDRRWELYASYAPTR
jgi:hypothetical protein